MRIRNCWFIFIIPIFLSCGLKQPIENNVQQAVGSVFVASTPPGADILLDRAGTAKVTPDTLFDIPVGLHSIRLVLPEFTARPDSQLVQVAENQVQRVDFVLQKIERVGRVVVATTPAGAQIYVDDQPSGRSTPDTLILQQGAYRVGVAKNGFMSQSWAVEVAQDSLVTLASHLQIRQRVLLEAFANVSCTPCVEAAHNLDQFREQTPNEQFVMLEYYANWPSPNDPFYKAAPEDAMQRVMYYKLTTLPSLFIGGSIGVDAARYDAIENAFAQARAAQTQQTAISLDRQLIDGVLNVRVEVYQFAEPAVSGDLRLYAAIIENDIHFDAPPGSNGLVDFNVVFRGFLSDRKGDALQAAEFQTLNYSIPWPGFVYENCKLLAFIQNFTTKEIIQSTIN